jgi:beta-mannosidase
MTRPLHLAIHGKCGASSFDAETMVRFAQGKFEFDVPEPCLWFPLGYGAANLYQVAIEVQDGDRVLARREETFGIRTVELVRTETTTINEPGEFLFRINGEPILCKGSNHVPADAFHSRDADRYETIVNLYRDAGCNIIRCWGGNVYEDHAFFDLCDRAGIMVWQDFSMACAFHPQEAEFLSTIHEEATAVVKKLRNHPSLILWSGDNEVDQGMFAHGMDPAMNRITREVLPQVVFAHDPHRPFLPSSPYYAPEVVSSRDENRMPEQHLWGPRDYYKSPFYTRHTAHFVSEIGYHGCPARESLEQFLDASALWPWQDNPQWIAHCTDAIGPQGPFAYRVALMAKQIREMFGSIPDTLDDFILASQISQAEAKKFFIEMTRLKKWRRTGVIWWNMIDGWPQFSDAVVDYYFHKKLAYHYIRRVQQPVCLMLDEPENWYCALVAGNDSLRDAHGTYRVRKASGGEILAQGEFHCPANRNILLARLPVSHGEQQLFLIEWEVDGKAGGNHYLLGHPAFQLEAYREWLPQISTLPDAFDWKIA